MQDTFSDRHHPFEGCFNFRDIGGYPTGDGRQVKWGRYFRAGRQDRMTEADLARLKSLGIKTQIDLRGTAEISDHGPGPLQGMGADYHNLQVIPEGGSLRLSQLTGYTGISGQRYLSYLAFGPDVWLRLFDLLANSGSAPILIHCTAGKDRTGVSTAFLLAALGVDRHVIETDYRFTNADLERQVKFIESTQGLPEGMTADELMFHAGVPDDAMGDFLDGLDEQYGSTVDYLRHIGVTEAQMEAVRGNFLEPTS